MSNKPLKYVMTIEVPSTVGTIYEIDCTVKYYAYPGYPQTRDEPGEDAYVEIESVTFNGIELYDIVSESEVERIDQYCNDDATEKSIGDYEYAMECEQGARNEAQHGRHGE